MNFKNRTIFTGDNLPVLRGLNTASVDLVYLDPPFNSKRQWNAPLGSKAAGAGFKDTWTLSDIDLEWHDQLAVLNPALYDVIRAARGAGGDSTMSYLLMMSVRLLELRRVLKPSGSIYLHCDPTESHSLKLMMDTIFGRDAFRREIVWSNEDASGFKSKAENWIRGHDCLLYYTAGGETTFNKQYAPLAERTIKRYDKVDSEGRRYKIYNAKDGTERIVYLNEARGRALGDVWSDILGFQTVNNTGEAVGYPTQKPTALLERIVLASTNEGDVVLDPFVGCATTPIAAEKHNRRWLGIDYSEKAIELVELRLAEQLGLASSLAIHRTDIPRRTDLGDLPHYKTHKTSLYVEQEGNCNLCLVWFEAANLSVDHIVPRKKGGTDHKDNLQLLCRACNSRKGDRTWESIKADYFKGRRQR